jgi:hypothetical protein
VTLAGRNVGASMVLGRAATAGSRGGRAAWPIVVGCGFPKAEDLGEGRKTDVTLRDPRVGRENRETAGANCVLG